MNCSISNLDCIYAPRCVRRKHERRNTSPLPEQKIPSPQAVVMKDIMPFDEDAQDLPFLNINSLELLHHFSSQTLKSLGATEFGEAERDIVIRVGLSSPYLMHEMLSLASLHMASLQPQRRKDLQHQATLLQNCAFRLFNESNSTSTLTIENCVPIFLFSGLVGLQALYEATKTASVDLEAYLDSFIGYIHMYRAINIVTSRYWKFLAGESELKSILQTTSNLPHEPYGIECESLKQMLSSAEMTEEMFEAHSQAIDRLQVIHDVESSVPGSREASYCSSAWILRLSPLFLESLAQRQPISLMVLSQYGKMLQNHSHEWVVGDSGTLLVQAVEQALQSQANAILTTQLSVQAMPP